MRVIYFLCVVVVLGFAMTARGVTLFSDNFESYASGAGDSTPLDKNTAGPNADTNGSGNPWWGPFPPNFRVVTTGDGGVTAHSGSKMIRGLSSGSDLDQDYYNLAYRLNGGNTFTGNLTVDWWFYDPLGSGGTDFRDYGALAFYSNVPGDTDYPSTPNTTLTGINQRLSLGATNQPGFDNTKYQARVVGASDGTMNAQGWYNLNVARSVGWHEARIALGDPAGTATQVSFYIDDMVNPRLVHSIMSPSGVDVVELNGAFGPTPGYFDDVTISAPPAGDYNHNGVVDAADYVRWRKELGTTFQPTDYDVWRANFGQTAGSGTTLSGTVPEPASTVMLVLGAVAICARRQRRWLLSSRIG
jgi:hypothetical protein